MKLRLLILNWRCPKNPQAGGAELVTYEVARRLVGWGDQVEWFSAAYPGAPAEEDLDGIHIIRAGTQWSVHWRAFRHYGGRLRGRFDAVIDEVNTIPFFTPLWARIPVFMFIHQLAREVWWYESRFPISAIGYAAEPLYLRAYRRIPVFTVSPSTETDLRQLGLCGPITIVREGLEPIEESASVKSSVPTAIYVGRLAPSKRVTDVIEAFARFHQVVPASRLWLVGEGHPAYVRRLRELVDQLRLTQEVSFWGRLPAPEKHRRMRQAHMLLMASAREGWGLVVTEANACGTPAVVYDVGGLRDAVRHKETGLVVDPSPTKLADGMLALWRDPVERRRLAEEARRWSQTFCFDETAGAIRDRIGESLAGLPSLMHTAPGELSA